MTRSDLTMAMHAQAGSPQPTMPATSPFNDLDESDESYVAAIWATQQNLMGGTDTTDFRPDVVVTRADTAEQIYDYNGAPAYSPPFYSPFIDVSTAMPRYLPITWMASTGLTEGEPTGHFHPHRPMTAPELEEIFRRMRAW